VLLYQFGVELINIRRVRMLKIQMKIVSILIIALLMVGVIIIFATYNPLNYPIYADISSYVIQTQSIVYDFDLKYEKKDLVRFKEIAWQSGPLGLFVNRVDNDYYYAKPFLYSLFSAPLVWLFGVRGHIIFNLLLFYLLIFIAFIFLQLKNNIKLSLLISLLFFIFSPAYIYIFVIHPDLFIVTLLSLFLFFYTLYFISTDNKKFAVVKILSKKIAIKKSLVLVLCGIFLGMGIYEKLPLIFFLFFIFIHFLIKRETKQAFLLLIIVLIVWFLPSIVHLMQIKSLSPYNPHKGVRLYLSNYFPFEENFSLELAHPFHPEKYFSLNNILNISRNSIAILPYNLFYYFIGRQTGLFIYIPFTIFIFVTICTQKLYLRTIFILISIICYILFYFLISPSNYYGGSGSFGNRYSLQIMPAYIFLILSLQPHGRFKKGTLYISFVFSLLIGFIFLGESIKNPIQKVAENLRFINTSNVKVLPIELTQINKIYEASPNYRYNFINGGSLFKINDYDNEDSCKHWSSHLKENKKYKYVYRSKQEDSKILFTIANNSFKHTINIKNKSYNKKIYLNENEIKQVLFTLKNGKMIGCGNDETHFYPFFIKLAEIKDQFINDFPNGKTKTSKNKNKCIKENKDVNIISMYELDLFENKKKYAFGDEILFRKGGNYNKYIGPGWSYPEKTHIWSNEYFASIYIPFENTENDLILSLIFAPFIVPGKVDFQTLKIYLNGEEVKILNLTESGIHKEEIRIKNSVLDSCVVDNLMEIVFVLPNAVSPMSVGYNNDQRILGIALKSMKVQD